MSAVINTQVLALVFSLINAWVFLYYGENSLYPTGPCLLGRYFTKEEKRNMKFYFENAKINGNDNYYIGYKNGKYEIIILKMYDRYRDEQKIYQKNQYYADLWQQKNIYK